MNTQTYIIPAEALPEIASALEPLAKKARKFGAAEPVLTVKETCLRTFGDGTALEMAVVTLATAPIKLNGYTVLGHIRRVGDESVVYAFNKEDSIGAYAAENAARCDHCGVNRYRTVSYVVRHDASGALAQVGSTCIADYIGYGDAQAILAYAEMLRALDAQCEEAQDGGDDRVYGRFARIYSIHTLLMWAAWAIEQHGWISKGAAQDRCCMSTSDYVCEALRELNPRGYLNEHHAAAADATLAYVASLEATSDYEMNLKAIYRSAEQRGGNIEAKWIGLAISAMAAMNRQQQREVTAQAQAAQSQHIGAVGGKVGIDVECVNEYAMQGAYGTTYIYTFRDADGNVLVWKTGSAVIYRGDKGRLTGKIKAHSEYRGVAQTEVTRCKWSEQAE